MPGLAARRTPCGHPLSEARVAHRRHNHSAFNGYRRTASERSEVRCPCGHRWRTYAAYVDLLPGECDR
jgi:hypothetical protein